MIQDLDSHESGDAIETDIVVVGSGPAGLSLAMRLAEHGLDVTILESGGTGYSAEAQDLNAGFDSRGREAYLQASRIRTFGGTSFHWGGWCRPLDAEDFRSRAWIDYSGWPLTAEELAPHYAAASRICDLDRAYFDLDRWVGERGQPALAWSDDRFHTSFFQLSPPTRFAKKYEDPVEKSDRIRVLLNATVSAVNLYESGGAVETLTVTRNDGPTVTLRARRYVLACGGIENARLLLLSNGVATDGVGNDRGLVGRFFMDHMGFSSGSIIPERSDLNLGLYVYDSHPDFRGFATIVPSVGLEESLKAARYNIELFPQFSGTSGYRDKLKGEYWELAGSYRRGKVFSEFGANMARLWGMASNGSSYLWGKAFGGGQLLERIDLRFHAETAPNPASRVTLDGSARDRLGQPRVRLDWQISDNDVAGWHRTLEPLAQACGASGIGRLQVEYDPVAGPDSLSFVSGYHHIGTTRMDVDPARGVVDGDCRVHGVENLYVAGSSVFPTAGHANPTLTIVALALRLADHLKDSS